MLRANSYWCRIETMGTCKGEGLFMRFWNFYLRAPGQCCRQRVPLRPRALWLAACSQPEFAMQALQDSQPLIWCDPPQPGRGRAHDTLSPSLEVVSGCGSEGLLGPQTRDLHCVKKPERGVCGLLAQPGNSHRRQIEHTWQHNKNLASALFLFFDLMLLTYSFCWLNCPT